MNTQIPRINAYNRRIQELYARDHAALDAAAHAQLRASAEQWNLTPILQRGGVIVFPHITVQDCGHHVLAAVNAVLDCQADRVIVISVLHPWTDEMQTARDGLAAGTDMQTNPLRGIQGPRFGQRDEWQFDHALMSWRYFWDLECSRRSLRGPEVIECYPYLAGSEPTTLPGYAELAGLAENAVIVSTADPFHHGIGYGHSPESARAPAAGGLDLARQSIEESNRLLANGDYAAYLQQCVRARNDARDAGPVLHALRGRTQATILDLVASDMTELHNAPTTWVAGALVTWE